MSDSLPKPQPDHDPEMTAWGAGPTGSASSRPAPAHEAGTKLSSDPEATIAQTGSRSPTPSSFVVTSHAVLFSPGTVLGGRYEILAQLGMGGMGAVYKAYDREVQRDIALKVIRPELAENPQILQRFKQELILAREVTHPNVVRIYDIGEAEGVKFITMKFVKGQDLGSLMTDGKGMEPNRAADIIYQVSQGLAAVHKQGIIHRDLKPGNIMLDEQGQVVLMDFGLARGVEGEGMTQTGAMLGTMQYMSPEQAKAEPLDQRSDIYTVGLIFYELLTGVSPYASESAITSLMKRTQERAKPASTCVQGIPPQLNDICSRCLEINPAHRFQNIGELLAAFDAWRGGIAPSQISIAARRMQRRFSWKYAVGICAVIILLVAGFVIVPRLRLTQPAGVGGQHAPVSVLVADFSNHTGDPVFDDTLEPMFGVALEGASFVNAFSRGQARKLAQKLPNPTDKLDEQSARLVALGQNVGAVVVGSLSRRGEGYALSVEAIDAVSGKTIGTAQVTAATKDEVLLAVPKLAVPVRKALGDTTPESVQLAAAGGAFTAASLEAVHAYGVGMEQQFAGKFQDALKSFSRAAELDPNFGRAYAGIAAASGNLGQMQDAEKFAKMAMAHVDRMTERERYRIRGLYYIRNENWQKCVEEYSDLVKEYPADNIGHNNLAGCYAKLQNLSAAQSETQRAIQISPKDTMARMNLSLYASLAGNFQGSEQAAREVLKLNPSFEQAVLVLAYAQLGKGELDEATSTYHQLAKMSARGASLAGTGLANIALFQGKLREASDLLEKGIAEDLAAKRPDPAAHKLVMLAQAKLMHGEDQQAVTAANRALANSKAASVRLLAARVLIAAHRPDKARELAATFGKELESEPRAYAKLIEGDIALQNGQAQDAVTAIAEGNKLTDTWIGRFDLGRAYLEAGAYAEADAEFDRCLKRRGEAMELFMDDMPTYSYFPAIYYYKGRALEGLKSSGAADSYRTYLSIRGNAGEDPLLADIRRRIGQ
jgi:tetratricopeptide (TPR) repeat protein/predicted Ser/Thr protein kinase